MGLDMYLDRKTYLNVGEVYKPEYRHSIQITCAEKATIIKPERIKYVIEEVGYWRKANQIHNWFVENVQGGQDDCGEYEVSKEKMQELLKNVLAALANRGKAESILPTRRGFFFGGCEYDEGYFNDLEDTKKILEEALSQDPDGDYYYHSSW